MNAVIENTEVLKEKSAFGLNDDQTGKFLKEYPDEAIIAALRGEQNLTKPVEQVLSIAESAFELIGANEDELPPHLVKALWHLEKLFNINKNLILNP